MTHTMMDIVKRDRSHKNQGHLLSLLNNNLKWSIEKSFFVMFNNIGKEFINIYVYLHIFKNTYKLYIDLNT